MMHDVVVLGTLDDQIAGQAALGATGAWSTSTKVPARSSLKSTTVAPPGGTVTVCTLVSGGDVMLPRL
jgi:hypothetical protein